MIWLRTFGGAVVYGTDGQPMVGAATQRRTLALLSVLAVAGDGGLSRDKLVGLLWSERAPRRARHSLTQAMYAARKALDCDDLFEGTEDIRLNPQRILSDVQELKRALQTGDHAAVARLYGGPFLDGLFVSSIEFERWVDGCRANFEEQAVAALRARVAEVEKAGDHAAALEAVRQLASVRPADSAIALQLMQALARTGDVTAAIQRAELHLRVLRDEFEMEDADVLALAEELRRTPPKAPYEVGGDRPSASLENGSAAATPSAESLPVRYELGGGQPGIWTRPRPIRKSGPWRSAAAVALVLSAGLMLARFQSDEITVVPLQQRIVVAPFRIAGADASLHFLREGMVELLSTRLADDTAARAVDAGSVLRAWRRAGINRGRDASNDTVATLAARLGAERVIVGSVVGTAGRAVVSAAVIKAGSGEMSGEATVEGPADSLTVLVDRLAGKLLASQVERDQPLSALTTTSLPALRAFLSAAPAFGAGDYRVAADRYERALRFDSTFALAAFRLGLAARRMSDFALERKAIAHAWRFRQTLSEQDRSHLMAWAGPQYPSESNYAESVAAWETAARLAPERADVWYEYAALIASTGVELEGMARERVIDALERAAQLDAGYALPRLLLRRFTGTLIRQRLGDTLSADADSVSSPFLVWRLAALEGDTARLRLFADTLPALGPVNLRLLAAASQFDGARPDDGLRALRLLSARAQSAEQAMDLLMAEHSLEVNAGHPSRAFIVSRRLQRISPASLAHLRLQVLDAVFAEGDTSVARLAALELERSLQNPKSRSAAANACALLQWNLARRDTVAARRALEVLQTSDGFEHAQPRAGARVCAFIGEATIAAVGGAGEARRALQQLDSLVLTTTTVGDVAAFAHIAIARLHRQLGQPTLALQAIRRRPYMSAGWPCYLATALREEGDLAQMLGDRAGALAAYTAFLSLRTEPEAMLQSQTAHALEAVRVLQSQIQ